jgi:hypothetical protein
MLTNISYIAFQHTQKEEKNKFEDILSIRHEEIILPTYSMELFTLNKNGIKQLNGIGG